MSHTSVAAKVGIAVLTVSGAFVAAKPAKAETNILSTSTVVCATRISDAGVRETACVGEENTIVVQTAPAADRFKMRGVCSDYPASERYVDDPVCPGTKRRAVKDGQRYNGG